MEGRESEEEGEEEARRGGGVRFHPMRLLLTGSSCLEKSPLWSFCPQGGLITSMGELSLGWRRKGKERGGEGMVQIEKR